MAHPQQQLITVATCNLNQWALDFDGNVDRILQSCRLAQAAGAAYRLGPELEIPGYGCEDHFLESDTVQHSWESLAMLLERGATDDLLCDFGMPVLFAGARYNCRVLVRNRRVLLVRPKTAMADDGNYRESRYFTAWKRPQRQPIDSIRSNACETLILPRMFHDKFAQTTAPFGTVPLEFRDGICLGCESCEELWTPQATHIEHALTGVEIVGNGSGSHHSLRKLDQRLELILAATRKCGGLYLYSNQRGCDGNRVYYDGGALIVLNGRVLAQGPQFGLDDVTVITATVDLDDVRSHRAALPSLGIQSVGTCSPRLALPCEGYLVQTASSQLVPTPPLDQVRQHTPEEECCLGPACWLWDYLRRSGAAGFFLPLSGGADSSAVATIVGAMCVLATDAARADPTGAVARDVRRLCGGVSKDDNKFWVPSSSQELAQHVLHTAFMGTENSSEKTLSRAQRLAEAVGAYHLSIAIDPMVQAVIKVFTITTGFTPKFSVHGGSNAQDLALQNIQARLRMVTAYLFAQLLPWVRQRSGFLLVLGSANVDEGLRGYMTKYDCSSADLNPIGAISKGDLKKMLSWAGNRYDWPVLHEIAGAPPTAELRPKADSFTNDMEHTQLDEDEMGMTYEELGHFGKLRKLQRCGPVSMFRKLVVLWSHLTVAEVAEKVKRFFFYYSINRHKMCTITPAYHAESYSPDDNRFDLRQFLYNVKWPRQFGVIDTLVQEMMCGRSQSHSAHD